MDTTIVFIEFFERVRSVTEVESQADLARALDLDPSSISAAKTRNNVPKSWAFKIGALYGVNPEWLFSGKGEPRPVDGVIVSGKPLDFTGYAVSGRDPNADPTPEPPATSAAIPEHLVVTRAVGQIEAAMREVGLDENSVWKAVKSMVDSKLNAQVYGYRPDHAEERPPLAAEVRTPYAQDAPERRQGERRKPDPKNEIGTQR